ncbi:Sirohydrochlorin ferrochelatase [Desulfofundulus thermosubterraneus DSM 16057]|uniref:Sirohydrochlorin ferrochelatase n=2 Tax=Desulfofundulus TaxID=2282741 RepID=A0A1M6JSX7_9FIRM|nr:Sirohydrochlorin ferrochelatase [Desulfofundulus thermosubterraneus DSM 16057]
MFVRQKRLKRLIGTSLILTLILFSCFFALPFQSSAAAEVKPGVLIVAHGTNDPEWTTPVWEAAYELRDNLPYPVALGFLEEIEPDIPTAVEQLNAAGVNKIVAVPLFISSYSNHIEEIKYVLGLREDLPGEEHEEPLERARPQGEVILTPAIDDHPLLAEVLAGQIGLLVENAGSEIGVLAAHGSDSEEGQIGWVDNLASLGMQIQERLANKGTPLKGIKYGFLFESLTPSLREAVYEAIYTDGATALVIPVMVSEGHFTGRKIPGILKEFPDGAYRYPEAGQRALVTFKKSYANRIVEWRAANELWPRPEVKKGGETTVLTLDKCQEIAQNAGKGYPDSVLAFRLAGVALPALWPDSPVVADDLMVVSLLPSEAGSKPVFDYMVGTADVKYMGNWKKITSVSPTFIFANKATGEVVWVHVKPDTFGGKDFFNLRNRVVNGQASPDEQAALKARQDLLLKNLLTRPAEAIFAWKKVSPLGVSSPDGALLKFSYANLGVEENKLCLCGSFAFRALGEGFAILYGERMPQQGRFEVVSGWATEGIDNALRLVAGEGNYVLQGEEPFNADNYYLAVTDRATSRTAVVKAKPQLFPEDFFALRSKVKQGTATPDEKARFQELRLQVIWSLLFKPTGEIFSVYTYSKGGTGGGGSGAPAPSADRVEKPVQAGVTTEAEVPGKVKVEVPAGAVSGANAMIKAEVVGNEKTAGAGMPLLGKVVDVTLKNGTLTGKITITLYFDKSKLAKDQEPAAFYYDEKVGRWVRLEGTVDLEKGTVTATVDHLTLFAVFAVAREVPPLPTPTPVVTFKDIQGHWAADAAGRLAGMGLISGYPDGTFRPDREVTRAEIAAIMVRALKVAPGGEQELKFRDSAKIPAWARGAVAAAVREGLVKGYPQPDGTATFEADRLVSRVEMAALVVRILEKKIGTVTPAELKFADAGTIPGWAKASVGAAVAKGIVAGYPDGTFRAEKPVIRAEAAAMVLRLLDAVGNR